MNDTLTTTVENENQENIKSSSGKTEYLIQLINNEIESIKEERQQPGWTIWALSGSLATLFWLMLNEIEKGQVSITTVIRLLIIISLIFDCFLYLKMSLPEATSSINAYGRFFITNQVFRKRSGLILFLVQFGLVLYFTYFLSNQVPQIANVLSYTVNGFNFLLFLLLLILSFIKYPLPRKPNPLTWSSRGFFMLFVIITCYLIYIYITELFIYTPTITSIRIAVLNATIYYIIFLISKISNPSPLLESLINIRRELTLGHLEYQTAAEQIDIAITGLRVSDVLQGYVENILVLFDEFNSKEQKIVIHISAIEKILQGTQNNLADEQIAILDSLTSSIMSIASEAEDILDKRIPYALKPLIWRMKLIKNYSSNSANEIEDVLSKIDAAIKNAKAQTYSILERSNNLQSLHGVLL